MNKDEAIETCEKIAQAVRLIETVHLMRAEATLARIQEQCQEIRHWLDVLDTVLQRSEKPGK